MSGLVHPREKAILYEYIWFNGHPVAQIDGTTVTHWTFTDHLTEKTKEKRGPA